MKKMQIYEPAMCCPTGLCGVNVDPELLRVSTTLSALEKGGVTVERFNLTSFPEAFVKNAEVNKLITDEGVEVLPAVVVDGEIVITKRYPRNDEFIKLLEISPERLKNNRPAKKESSCCCGGGEECC